MDPLGIMWVTPDESSHKYDERAVEHSDERKCLAAPLRRSSIHPTWLPERSDRNRDDLATSISDLAITQKTILELFFG